jgi:hypothetical protein
MWTEVKPEYHNITLANYPIEVRILYKHTNYENRKSTTAFVIRKFVFSSYFGEIMKSK